MRHSIIWATLFAWVAVSGLSAKVDYETAIFQTPNPRTKNAWVVNPDHILTETQEKALNAALEELHKKQTIEFAVVVRQSIGVASVKQFSHQLFNRWGVGKKIKNNGLLFVLSIDDRGWAFETGDGLEATLPDSKQGTIARRFMVPEFRKGDFGKGVHDGVLEVVRYLSAEKIEYQDTGISSTEVNVVPEPQYYLLLGNFRSLSFIFLMLLLLLIGLQLIRTIQVRKAPNSAIKFQDFKRRYLLLGIPLALLVSYFIFQGFFIPLYTLAPLYFGLFYLFKGRIRNGKHHCQQCSTEMHMLDEEKDDFHLEAGQIKEEELGSMDYDVWHCTKDDHIQIEPYKMWSRYKACERCEYRTYKQVENRTISSPTYSSSGTGERVYKCSNCHHSHRETYTIPQLTRSTSSSSSSSSSSSWSSSSSSGSSFGGGSSSGGGASGSW